VLFITKKNVIYNYKMKILELFKGTGSITNHFEDMDNVEVISLDILKKYNPTICCDIMDFDYKQFDIGYFDIIWASPECKVFSMLQNTHIGKKWKNKEELENVRKDNSIFINKTIEIIDYLKPEFYFIENPRYSKMWDYIENDIYKDKFILVDYCYFDYPYKKPTKILTNKKLNNMLCKCTGNPKHPLRLGVYGGKMANVLKVNRIKDNTTLNQRYSIPPKLLDYLLT